MFWDEVAEEITDTTLKLYDNFKPWYYDQKYLLSYNSTETIKLILKHNDIELHKRNFRLEKFCGLLSIHDYGISIAINENHIPSKQLFTTAHELGHYYLHRSLQSQFIDQGLKENVYSGSELIMERQANLFASELLVPLEVLDKMFEKKYSFFKIAKTIGVSKEALKWRIVRYLQNKYNIYYSFALKLVEEYKDKSMNQRTSEALMFEMTMDKYILFEIFESLSGRESYIENYKLPAKVGVFI